jgi:hypothetical protein
MVLSSQPFNMLPPVTRRLLSPIDGWFWFVALRANGDYFFDRHTGLLSAIVALACRSILRRDPF